MTAGPGALGAASVGWGRFGVLTTRSPWALAAPLLAAAPARVARVATLERAELERTAADLRGVERAVGLGGGLALDAAKFVARRLGVPLVQVPSSVSNNACFTRTSGSLAKGRRAPMPDCPVPEAVVVDHGLIARAPGRLNRAGVGDLLSSHSALRDWELAHRAGREVDWDPAVRDRTQRELEGLARLAPEVGRDRLEAFVGLLAIGERFAPTFLRLPRARFNAASEHLLAWCLEERTGRRLLHGEIVSLGVLLMAHLQGNAPERAAATIRAAGVTVQPAAIGTTWAEVEAAVLALPEYARDVVPWYTVVDPLVEGDPARRQLRARFREAQAFVEGLG
ncbi:MAG TPA: iron-containing alcohol dehydrogenase [Methylomirabilota bacterium]|jgi:glycerol-1-phosphate dehydrogenase [NAD(P)+]|nr:iron-containing alcohol dehydrogenase [Methylomirabilota bacterium]